MKLAFVVAGLLALIVGCTSPTEPELPPSSDTAAVADRLSGPDGPAFLRAITTTSWGDDGRRAGELLAWIPRDAESADQPAATRAGRTAQSASFIADNRDTIKDAPANLPLWQAFSRSLIPYLGATAGDDSGVAGYEPLDSLDSPMRHTTNMFAAMTKSADANRGFTEAASRRAESYEQAFAKAAVADRASAATGEAQCDLLQAARLRSLVATGAYVADPESAKPSASHAQTQVAYQVASLTARPGDPTIDPKFFSDGRLRPPNEIPDDTWSLYDSQLTVYLASSPPITNAIRQFGKP